MERIAHRGARRERPENTIAAFERAFDLAADAIELDVHATLDGVLVVHHDPDVAGSVSRARRPIAETTWEEMRATGAGTDTSVPRLADVLSMTSTRAPRATVYVEVKAVGIEALVAKALADSPVSCAAHSFDHATIDTLARVAPAIPRGLLFESDASGLEAAVRRAGARDVWPHHSLIDARLVARARVVNARIVAWTVNDRREAERLIALGVDGICTDDVRMLDGL